MKRIVLSLGAITFVAALAVSATGAFFSDTETSTGNTFTAGELDLKIDNHSYGFDYNNPDIGEPSGAWITNTFNTWALSDLTEQLFFRFDDLKPGDYGEDTISLHVQNPAWACMDLTLTGTPENIRNEAEVEAGDATAGDQEGELQNYLNLAFWRDDGDNVYEDGEGSLLFNGPVSQINGEQKVPLADANTGQGPIPNTPGDTAGAYIGKFWCFGTITGAPVAQEANANGPTATHTGFTCTHQDPGDNVAQTDGVVIDVSFEAVQSRNNGQFLCNPQTAPETGTVMLDKIVQFTQTSVVGVDVNDFTLHLVGPSPALTDHVLVDQVAFPGLTPGAYTVSEVYSGAPPGVIFNASFSGGCAEIGDTGEATMTVVAGVNPTCTITNLVNSTS